jgi:hypothetical protein
VYITRKIIPADYATFVRDYARGNLDEAELWEELTTLGYSSSEIELRIQVGVGEVRGLKWMKS